MPEPYAIRTHDGCFLYANLALAKLSGIRSGHDFLGRYDHEIPSRLFDNEEDSANWADQDRKVVSMRKRLAMLEIHPDAVDMPYICRKVPFYNNDGEVIGSFCHIRYLEVFTPNDFVKGRVPGSLLLNKPDDTFTEKECEIIFFRLQGMIIDDIAKVVCLSPRTVEKRLAVMYAKAGVNRLDDFRDFCEQRNLHRYVPPRIISYRKIGFREDYEKDLSE